MIIFEEFIDRFAGACEVNSNHLPLFKGVLLEFARLVVTDADFQKEVLKEIEKFDCEYPT
jgi:hypothetical protein